MVRPKRNKQCSDLGNKDIIYKGLLALKYWSFDIFMFKIWNIFLELLIDMKFWNMCEIHRS